LGICFLLLVRIVWGLSGFPCRLLQGSYIFFFAQSAPLLGVLTFSFFGQWISIIAINMFVSTFNVGVINLFVSTFSVGVILRRLSLMNNLLIVCFGGSVPPT
jgi:hypothetical protein